MKRILKNALIYLFFRFSWIINYLFPYSIEIYDPRKQPKKNIAPPTQKLSPYIKQTEFVIEFKKYVDAQVARLGGHIEWVDVAPGVCYFNMHLDSEDKENELLDIIEFINQNGIPKEAAAQTPVQENKKIDPDIEDLLNGISNPKQT